VKTFAEKERDFNRPEDIVIKNELK